jgi:streptogramin lyase
MVRTLVNGRRLFENTEFPLEGVFTMWPKCRSKRNRLGNSLKKNRQPRATNSRRLWLEPLEDRTLPSIYFPDLSIQLVGGTSNGQNVAGLFPSITQEIQSFIGNADPVPFVGTQLANLFNSKGNLDSHFNPLLGPLDQIGNALANPDVSQGLQTGIANAVSNIPGMTVGNVTVSPDNVNATSITVGMDINETLVTVNSSLVPNFDMSALNGSHNFLTVDAGSTKNFQVNVGFTFHLSFTYTDATSQSPASLTPDFSHNAPGTTPPTNVTYPLLLRVTAQSTDSNTLPLTFTGKLNNSLFASTLPGASDPSVLTGNFGVQLAAAGSTPLLLGITLTNYTDPTNKVMPSEATLNLPLNLEFGDPSKNTLPFDLRLSTILSLDWQFTDNNGSLSSGRDNFGTVTSAAFTQPSLQIDPLKGLVDNTIGKIQQFAQPFKPIVSILTAEVPGLIALGIHVSIASALQAFGYDITPFTNFIDAATSLNVDSSTWSGAIQYNDIALDSQQTDDLRLVDLRAGSEQQTGGGVKSNPISTAISNIENELSFHDDKNSYSLTFPIVDQQAPLGNVLLGHNDASLISLETHLALEAHFALGSFPVAFIIVTPHVDLTFNLDLSLGYDESGFTLAAQEPKGTGAATLTNDELFGFFFGLSGSPGQPGYSGFSISPGVGLDASAAFLVTVSGNLTGTISLTLRSDKDEGVGPASDKRHLDSTFVQDIEGDPLCALKLTGSITVGFSIEVGFDPPSPLPHITLFEYDLPRITLYDFTVECQSPSFSTNPTISIPLLPGDHAITVHEFSIADPQNPGGRIKGIEWVDDSSNGRQVHRIETDTVDAKSNDQIVNQVNTIVVAPELDAFGNLALSGNDTVLIGDNVVGDTLNGDPVNILMVGTDGGNDDFENYAPGIQTGLAQGQAVLIGGNKTNTLIGGQVEYGGGLPLNWDYSSFPGFVSSVSVDAQVVLGYQNSGLAILGPGNPLVNAPSLFQLFSTDGTDILVGTPGPDQLHGGSGINTFVGLGGGDSLYGNTGNDYGTPTNTFIESALNGPLTPGSKTLPIDDNLDFVFGGNSTNLIEFSGYVHGEGNDNITVTAAPFFGVPGLLITDANPFDNTQQRSVFASNITDLAVEAGNGTINLGDFSQLPLKTTAVKFDLHLFGANTVNTLNVDTTSKTQTPTGPTSNPDYWTVQQDPNQAKHSGLIQLKSQNEGFFTIQGLQTSVSSFNRTIQDQLIFDDTGRDSNSLTFNLRSLPPSGPALTLNLGPGSDYLYVTQGQDKGLDALNGDGLTINGYTDGLGLSTDSLHIDDSLAAVDRPTWDVAGSTVSRQGQGSVVVATVNYNRIGHLDLQGSSDAIFDLSPTTMNLNELPPDIFLSGEPNLLNLNVYDQSDFANENWSVSATEITRSLMNGDRLAHLLFDRHIFYTANAKFIGLYNFDIEGGAGGSQFQIDPASGPTSGGNLNELGMFLTINGHGVNDSLGFDDSNDPIPGEISWNLSGSTVDESNLDYRTQFIYSDIQNLIIAGNDNPNTIKLSPTVANLDELPPNVQVQHPLGNANYQIVINDQKAQPTDLFGNGLTTTWNISGARVVRTYPASLPGLPPVQRTISFNDAPTSFFGVTIIGGMGDDNFLVQPTVFNNGTNNDLLLPATLAFEGGGGTNSLQFDASADSGFTWSMNSGVIRSDLILAGNVTTYSSVGRVEVDASGNFSVLGTTPGVSTFIDGGGTFDIGAASQIQGQLTINGVGSNNTVTRDPFPQYFPIKPADSGVSGITVTADGSKWFTEFNANQIGHLLPDGTMKEYPGPTDIAAGTGPTEIVTGPDGRLYFLVEGDDRIFQFDPNQLQITSAFVPLANAPSQIISDLVSGPDSLVSFTDYNNGSYYVGQFDTKSGAVNLFPVKNNEVPAALTVGPDGNLWFTDISGVAGGSYVANYLSTITPKGETDFSFPKFRFAPISNTLDSAITSMTAGPDGNLWATLYTSIKIAGAKRYHGTIVQISTQGQVLQSFPLLQAQALNGLNNIPTQIVRGPDGNLWFNDMDIDLSDLSDLGDDVTSDLQGAFEDFDKLNDGDPDLSDNDIAVITPAGRIKSYLTLSDFPGINDMTAAPDSIWFTQFAIIPGNVNSPYNNIGEIPISTQPAQWQVDGSNVGGLYHNAVRFTDIQNLTGGLGGDTFQFLSTAQSPAVLSGKLTGGLSPATLDESQDPGVTVTPAGAGTVHGSKGTATNILGGFDNIDTIINNTGANVVIDDSANTLPTTWTITASGVTRQVQGQSAVTTDLSNPTFFSGLNRLEIDAGSGGNTFNILGTAAGWALTINGGSGGDAYNFGDPTHPLTDLQGPMTFNPGSGVNSLAVDASGTPILVDATLDLASAVITQIGFPALDASSKDAAKMTIHIGAAVSLAGGVNFNTGSSSDSVSLKGLPVNAPFGLTGSGQSSLNIGGADGLDDIGSNLTIYAPAILTLNDQPDSLPGIYMLTTSSLTFKHGSTVTSGSRGLTISTPHNPSLLTVTINGGGGGNVIDVLSTAAGTTTMINSQGNDTVDIGNRTDGVGDIQGSVTVTNNPAVGYTDLIVDDSAYNRGYWWPVLSESSIITQVRTDGGNPVQVAPINYNQGDLRSLALLLGSSPGPYANMATVANSPTSGVPGGLMTMITTGTPTAGPGSDQVFVGATTGALTVNLKGGYGQEGVSVGAFTRTLDPIQGAVTVNSPSGFGTNVAVFDDASTVGQHYIVTNDTVMGRSGLPVITYHLNNALQLFTSAGVNTIDVKSTSVATVLAFGISGHDVLNVGDSSNTLNGITGGYLAIHSVNPGNQVNLNDQGDPNIRAYSFIALPGNLPTLVRSGSPALVFTGSLQTLALNGSSGGDTYNVQYIQVPVFIHNHPSDVVNVGNAGSVQQILGPLSVDAANTMIVDDSADPTPQTFHVSATSITRLAPAAINYGPGVANLTIYGGYGGNLIGVLDTAAGTTTTLNTGNGVDHVYVFATTGPLTVNTQQGGTAPGFHGFETVIVGGPVGNAGTLDTIQGALTINTLGRPGVDFASVALFDLATIIPETYTITSNAILRSGAAPIYYRVTNELEFRLGSRGNIVNIQSTFPGLPDLFVGGVGNDTFNVGDSANTLNGIQSHLSFQIANPGSQVILHDEGQTANVSYTLAYDPNISPSNFIQRSTSGYYILYSGPLKSLQLNAGSGNDTFNVRTLPPSSTTVTLDGGAGINMLQGPNQNNTWQITAPNAGSLDANVNFGNVQNLIGGTANDTFAIRKSPFFRFGGRLSGAINGGGGTDTLDYSGYTGDVTVNLRLGTASQVQGGITNIADVTGSIGNDLIVGDANPNVLIGGTGRNIIIGGAGPDQITGGGGDNILIGGTTVWDANPTALQAIMQEWTNATLGFDQRVNALKKGITVGGKTYVLNTSTVIKDSSPDSLIGGPGQNWFFVDFDDVINNGVGPGTNDRVTHV